MLEAAERLHPDMIVLDLNLPNVRTGSVSSARGSEPERKVNVFTAMRFEHVIGHAHLGELGDHRVPQIVEP